MKTLQKKVVIIGGGASGLAAAINLKKKYPHGVEVIILERANKIGRKLLVSGNGRCNFSNSFVNEKFYNNPAFLKDHLKEFNYETVKNFYEDLGLFISQPDNEGRVYPITFAASTIMDSYNNAIENLGIKIKLNCKVVDFSCLGTGYRILCENQETFECDFLIISCGSNAYTNFENDFISKRFKTIKPLCSLCPLLGEKKQLKYLENVRVKVNITLDNFVERGEVLFKSDRLSGIVIYNLSSYLAKNKIETATVLIDTLPDFSEDDIIKKLNSNAKLAKNVLELLTGIAAKGIAQSILTRLNIHHTDSPNEIANNFVQIARLLKNLDFSIRQNNEPKDAQVISGGINIGHINNETFQSLDYKNVFVLGEVLDIDGVCGGFNLHFAVSSALAATKEISKLCF